MRIATIIVSWNQPRLTLECLAALAAQTVQEDIWLVDNGSQPALSPPTAACFPRVRLLRLERNCGFAAGCNQGVAAALAEGTDAFFLLNNDALLAPGALRALADALEGDSRVAAVAPKVYFAGTPRVIQSVGLWVDADSGRARMLGSGEPDRGQYDQPADRVALFGCALLIRRAAWEEVGPFWEPFFAYAEETDWCLRARGRGWRLRYVPEAAVWHRTSSSLGAESPRKVYLIARNQYYLRRRNARRGWRGAWGLARALAGSGRTWARYLRRGQRAQAQALKLGVWDYARGRSGPPREL